MNGKLSTQEGCARCGKPHNAGTRDTHEFTADGKSIIYFRICRNQRRCDERMEAKLQRV